MAEDKDKVSVVGAPANATPTPEESDSIDDIVDDLEADITEDEAEESDAPQSKQEAPEIDISKLTIPQLQELAARLNATPSRAETETKKMLVKLRDHNGRIIVDFKNAYIGLVDDPENHRQIERHIIPVRYHGEKEFVNMRYDRFMQLPQVDVEVVRTRTEDASRTVGQTYNEHDELVEMKVTAVKHIFDVVLPSGEEITIEGKVANG